MTLRTEHAGELAAALCVAAGIERDRRLPVETFRYKFGRWVWCHVCRRWVDNAPCEHVRRKAGA